MKKTKKDSDQKKRKYFKLTIFGIAAIIFGFLVFISIDTIINHDKTANIKIVVAPASATVKIGDETYNTNTTIRIKPGTYEVSIEKDGFKPYKNTIEAKQYETSYLYEYLEEKDENGTYYQNNDYNLVQQISDFKNDLTRETYTNSDPIWNITPYYSYEKGIKITADKAEDGKILIHVRFQTCLDSNIETLKNAAEEYLKYHNIDLKNYTIDYAKLC